MTRNIIERNAESWSAMPTTDMHVDVNLIRCLKRLFPEARGKKLLCIGFGEGQNLEYMSDLGFTCYGTEIAESRFDRAKEKLSRRGVSLKLVDSNALPYKSKFFDFVVAWQSIYYNDEVGLKKTLSEVHRVLKTKGTFLSSMLSDKHALCAKKIGKNIYSPNISSQKDCVVYGFKNKKQILTLYGKFKNIKIGFYATSLFKSYDFHYVIYCSK